LLPDDQDSNHGRRERNDEEVMHSGGSDYARKNSGKEGRTSLAEDIHSIRIALNGASTTAKERTLKTLERLTARLALAESERDVALGMCAINLSEVFIKEIISKITRLTCGS
jgi:hypothetical protein